MLTHLEAGDEKTPRFSKAAGPAAAAAVEEFTRQVAIRSLERAHERVAGTGEPAVVTSEDVQMITAGVLLDFR